MDIKENFAANLSRYRKAMGITQAELAEKINYSDKAVSKWERGESLPDLVVVKTIADLFGVSLDALVAEPTPEKPKISVFTNKRRSILYLIAMGAIWLIAILIYVFLDMIPSVSHEWPTWLALIYALPVSSVVIFIFASVWKNKVLNTIFSSLFVWTTLLSVFLSCIMMLAPPPPPSLWEIFLIGIPLQALIIFFFFYKKVNLSDKKHNR